MAMTAWAAKFVDQLDLLVGERTDLLAIDGDSADQLVFLEHRHDDNRARTAQVWRSARAGYSARISIRSDDVV